MRFDMNSVRLTREKLQGALQKLEVELGCVVRVGNATFDRDGTNCTFKIDMSVVNDGGVPQTRQMSNFRSLAVLYGLKPEDLGTQFTISGETYLITGASPKSSKYPIIGKRVRDGKSFKFSSYAVKSVMGQ